MSGSAWGGACLACGHPSTYHGTTFCQVQAGSSVKRQCDCGGYATPDAAAPHLTADLVRERDALAAEVERLQEVCESLAKQHSFCDSTATVRAEKAEAAIAESVRRYPHTGCDTYDPMCATCGGPPALHPAALRSDQPCATCGHESHDDTGCDVGRWTSAPCQCGLRGGQP